jgi:peptidyl-prolyl cis-trans isomerase B (cyclophilin B)
LDRQYTAFGKLVAGVEVLKQIGDAPTKLDRSSGELSVPVERIEIQKITILPRETAGK